MGRFAERWTRVQRDAVTSALLDRGVPTAVAVAALARAGELEWNGTALPPFDMPVATIRSLKRDELKRRAGRSRTPLADIPHRDAIDDLRVRLIAAADATLRSQERVLERTPGRADVARLRDIVRLVKEASALPDRTDPRPVQPGQRIPGTDKHAGSASRHGLAGAILKAHRGGSASAPAQDVQTHHGHTEDQDAHEHERGQDDTSSQPSEREDTAVALARALVSMAAGEQGLEQGEAGGNGRATSRMPLDPTL